MSRHPDAAALVAAEIASDRWSNPAACVARFTGLAADANWAGGGGHPRQPSNSPRLFTHVAAALVEAAANTSVKRGAVLESLIASYGDGLDP